MRESVTLDTKDIKEILAEKFRVPEKNIIKSQYTYTVILDDADEPDREED